MLGIYGMGGLGADINDLAFKNFQGLLNQGIILEIVLVKRRGFRFCRLRRRRLCRRRRWRGRVSRRAFFSIWAALRPG